MTVNLALMFIVTILGPKNGWTDRTSEMFNVIFPFQCSDVRTPKSTPAIEAKQIQTTEIVGFAQGKLAATISSVQGEEFRSDDLSTILDLKD